MRKYQSICLEIRLFNPLYKHLITFLTEISENSCKNLKARYNQECLDRLCDNDEHSFRLNLKE